MNLHRLATHIDGVIDGALSRERLVGAVVLVALDGETVYRRAAGYADRERGLAMNEEVIFRLASVTKPIVSVAALALLDSGHLHLDEPVTTWLPGFRPKLPSGLEPDITVRHLLTHTSGLDYGFGQFRNAFQAAGVSNGLDHPGLAVTDQLHRLSQVPLIFPPGSSWNYSLSTDVLGAAMAVASALPLPELIRRKVTEPLGMGHTAFRALDTKRLAVAYGDAWPRPVPMGDSFELPSPTGIVCFSPSRALDQRSYPSGGAGMLGTAGDFLTFLEALRKGGGPILHERSARMLSSDQLPQTVSYPDLGWRFGMGAAVLCEPSLCRTPHDKGTWRWGGAYGHDWFVNPHRRLTMVSFTNTALEGVDGAFPVDIRDAIYHSLPT